MKVARAVKEEKAMRRLFRVAYKMATKRGGRREEEESAIASVHSRAVGKQAGPRRIRSHAPSS